MKNKPKIDFLGIADQKSATSWIYKCLQEHPEVCGFPNKETRFFDDDSLYKQGLAKYQDFFDHCKSSKVVGEYSPSYIHSEKALKRIRKNYPKAKLIVCFRNPTEKIYSSYVYNKVSGTGAMKQYDSFLEAVKDRNSMMKRAKHGKNLERVYEYFSKKQVFVGLYDDLDESPREFMQNLYSFLGIDDSYVPDSVEEKYNVTGEIEFRSDELARLLAYVSESIRSVPILKKFLEKLGVQKVYRRIMAINRTQKNKEAEEKGEVGDKAKKLIKNDLRKDITKLESLIDRDLSHWR